MDVEVPYVVRMNDHDFEFKDAELLFMTVIGTVGGIPEFELPLTIPILNVDEFCTDQILYVGEDGFVFYTDNKHSRLKKKWEAFLERENL